MCEVYKIFMVSYSYQWLQHQNIVEDKLCKFYVLVYQGYNREVSRIKQIKQITTGGSTRKIYSCCCLDQRCTWPSQLNSPWLQMGITRIDSEWACYCMLPNTNIHRFEDKKRSLQGIEEAKRRSPPSLCS